MGVVGLVGAAALPPTAGLAALTVASFGVMGMLPVFWLLLPRLLTGRAAAGGFALINSIGALGGVVGPTLVGAAKDSTGSLAPGMLALAGVLLIAALLTLTVRMGAPSTRTRLVPRAESQSS
ncbi:hypothetical protein [Streptomyces narbonensis]|uniref:hypothetical protein n=1 Tax=Streptomyces narbonensis TaxID=67333 RepID=UPI0033EF05BE